ncbi:MAG: C4-dicarboxylate transporter DcuC [Veillonella sp.]|uniref:C4-dicarboxylate transporter DcuC n=1 Tax=Veillonella caviae TaxID=248316 RepID=UPI000F8F5032|nr:C4-dicarboxylate transporter DcuC [Veillonella caviae]MCF0157178.1 C4-dicarboxylate transporter DcuC [Veillonella sp.]
MNLLLCAIVIVITGSLVIKKFKAQTVLLLGGLIMMFGAYLLGYTTEFVEAKKSTGVLFFDAFEWINITTAKDAANLGLMIMTCTGFAKYMDHIGASSRLVTTAIRPLSKMKSPYLVLSLTFIINMFMSLVIPSASGLAMLMMVTIFPILVRLGVSPVGAAAAVATGHLLDIGPASATSLLVAKTVNMPIHEYFVGYQLKVYVICGLVAAVTHYFWQQYMDKKSGHVPAQYVEEHKGDDLEVGPWPYIFLPLLPLIFILGFSEYAIQGVKMNVNLAMFLSLFIAMGCELIRHRDFRKMAASIQTFFKGMGDQFASTVTLIVAGETFAFGLTSLGIVKEFATSIQSWAITADIVAVIVSVIIVALSVVMGSGVASMFAFAPLVPNFAKELGGNAVTMLLGMQNAASVGRLLSPISAVMIAVAGIANISSFDLVKRTSVPVIMTFITSTICILIFH